MNNAVRKIHSRVLVHFQKRIVFDVLIFVISYYACEDVLLKEIFSKKYSRVLAMGCEVQNVLFSIG